LFLRRALVPQGASTPHCRFGPSCTKYFSMRGLFDPVCHSSFFITFCLWVEFWIFSSRLTYNPFRRLGTPLLTSRAILSPAHPKKLFPSLVPIAFLQSFLRYANVLLWSRVTPAQGRPQINPPPPLRGGPSPFRKQVSFPNSYPFFLLCGWLACEPSWGPAKAPFWCPPSLSLGTPLQRGPLWLKNFPFESH